ncbi:aminotransferase class I/II-fold pyridoxal phosphate-dependent enzyme [Clostridium sp. D2Q-14]|uniref:aminotransferase class I/II-fold pyridoxal phosphate-dependent enzyme n=1 Tax=Anaeromonas gelatinilytica TaxID=2683194 RepID=UPI00193C4D93|nr:aminotransferase class I/II-fold pyridoxal phosphate-dependent enzyme [Anaeromonas gelatinilytica]MBS4535906.1 aminotransferase class I/II-fold pyridoxal phosphate-dependent enzyme [Anaeromonas gelatinilytica]
MKTPIIKGLLKYNDEKNIRFHMPGHKGRRIYGLGCSISEIDVTEVDGTDNLHNPKDIIKESQDKASRIYGVKKTFYSINGTTGGIYAAITAATKPGDEILIQRNCHKSVYNAMVLGRLKANYIYPEYDEENNILTTIGADKIDEILVNNEKIKAVVITYPSYFGICSDIKAIAGIVHKHNRILIVDEAHGSHLIFNDELPISAEEAKGDIIIQSTHKTLPAYTQSSMLHITSNRVGMDRMKRTMSMYQTTSPSYILMYSLDMALGYMESEGKYRFKEVLKYIDEFNKKISKLEGISIFTGGDNYQFDKTKILIRATTIGLTGNELEDILRKDYNIQLEMADLYYGLAMASVLSERGDFDKLYIALKDISEKYKNNKEKKEIKSIKYIYPEQKIPIYEAFNKDNKIVSLDKAEGKVLGDYIIPYPPGIPILVPGERITKEIIEYIKEINNAKIEILGLKNGKISII